MLCAVLCMAGKGSCQPFMLCPLSCALDIGPARAKCYKRNSLKVASPQLCRRGGSAGGRVTIGSSILGRGMVLAQCLHTLDVSLRLNACNWRAAPVVPRLQALSWRAGIRQQSLPQRLSLQPVAAQSRHVWASSVLMKPVGKCNGSRAHVRIIRVRSSALVFLRSVQLMLSFCPRSPCRRAHSCRQANYRIHDTSTGDHRSGRHSS